MTKRVIKWFIIMLICVFVAWIVIININDNKKNYELVEEDGKTIYKVNDIMYQVVDDSDTILIDTEEGIMIADLYPDVAPITVKNFKKLIKEGFYKNLIFHRVIKDFMIQTGDPTGTGSGGSEETIKGEFSENGVKNELSHKRGILSMARAGGNPDTDATRNSASSQFFIVHKDSDYLDGKYASFGLLLYGYDVLDKIASVQTDENDKPITDQVLKDIKFLSVYRK